MPNVIQRDGCKGVFVLWPKDWPVQWRDPIGRRHSSKCDMLIGHCQCGRVHRVEDNDIRALLQQYESIIETHKQWLQRTREVAPPCKI